MSFISRLLEFLGLKKKTKTPARPSPPVAGTEGILEADAALVLKEDRIVLVVDQEFKDIPGWIEWDIGMNKLSIAQMGGATASLNALVPLEAADRLRSVNRMLLIAKYHGRRVVHFLAFVIRD